MPGLGKLLILSGALLVVLGTLVLLGDRIPWLGRLPGDIRIEREHFRLYFPLATGILISVLLSGLLSLILWLFRR